MNNAIKMRTALIKNSFPKKLFFGTRIRHCSDKPLEGLDPGVKKRYQKMIKRMEKDRPGIAKNMRELQQKFESMSPKQKEEFFRLSGYGEIIESMPPVLMDNPLSAPLAFALLKLFDSEELQNVMNREPIEEDIGTDYTDVSELECGSKGTSSWKMSYIGGYTDEFEMPAPESIISLWHDLGLNMKKEGHVDYYDEDIIHLQMFVLNPKGSTIWNRLAKDERMNPVRHMCNLNNSVLKMKYPCHFNVGFLPQTWLDPRIKCFETLQYYEDNPLMAIDISGIEQKMNSVHVRLLGAFALFPVRSTRVKWVMIVCNEEDHFFDEVENIHDVPKMLPGLLSRVKEFLKQPLPFNKNFLVESIFHQEGKLISFETADKVLKQANYMWKELIEKNRSTPTPYYIHHPAVRNGEAMSTEPSPSMTMATDHFLGLSVEERVKKHWTALDAKNAHYRSMYLEKTLDNEKRKNKLVSSYSKPPLYTFPQL